MGLLVATAAVSMAKPSNTRLPHIREPKYPGKRQSPTRLNTLNPAPDQALQPFDPRQVTKKCDPAVCICTPEAFVEAFLATPNLSGNTTQNPSVDTNVMNTNLCVGEHLVGRVNGWRIPSTNPTMAYLGTCWSPGWAPGTRRPCSFVFAPPGRAHPHRLQPMDDVRL